VYFVFFAQATDSVTAVPLAVATPCTARTSEILIHTISFKGLQLHKAIRPLAESCIHISENVIVDNIENPQSGYVGKFSRYCTIQSIVMKVKLLHITETSKLQRNFFLQIIVGYKKRQQKKDESRIEI
jgi:hypothetical protein